MFRTDNGLNFTTFNQHELFIEDLEKLSIGMATPLKINFQPKIPFFPLKISSLNTGQTIIEVYLNSEKPMKDKNNILKRDKTKQISQNLENTLKEHLDLKNSKYVTRFSYKGDLIKLKNDAVFEYEKSVFIKMWELVKNIFG